MSMAEQQRNLLMGMLKDSTKVYIADYCKDEFSLLKKCDPDNGKSFVYDEESYTDES